MPFSDIPPSYDSSISRETWTVIAPYIPSADLCSCCLVSRKWHSIFVGFLWGDPASHFGIANDAVYVALTRFKRTLRRVRLGVRCLTHTLHLVPALSEIYGGPNPTWLKDVLEYLPNLQSLIVSKLPFFDHHSLLALRDPTEGRRRSDEEQEPLPEFGLKLLLASDEPNTTSIGLSTALPRFLHLVYLDLSYTKAAKDASVLFALSNLYDLQILKLRGVGLKDSEAEVLANAIGIRVRLLDIRDNLLTDMAVRSLMQACFLPFVKNPNAANMNSRRVEDWPVGMAPGPDFFSLDTLRGEELDRELLKQLTNPLTGRLAFEDIPHRGLTHLYVSGNHLSVEGLSSLLQSERLHILDGGSVDAAKTIVRAHSLTSPTGYHDEVRFPGAEKLIPVLAQFASKNLTYLRVDHALVTTKWDNLKETSRKKSDAVELPSGVSTALELPGSDRPVVELPAPARYPVELPAEQDTVFELDATPAQPRYELAGDIIHFAVTPAIGNKPEELENSDDPPEPVRGEGAFAPEVVLKENDRMKNIHNGTDPDHIVTPVTAYISDESSTMSSDRMSSSSVSPMTPYLPRKFAFKKQEQSLPKSQFTPISASSSQNPHALPMQTPSKFRQRRIDTLLEKRPRSLSLSASHSSGGSKHTNPAASSLTAFHPSALPNLRTLILTNVPNSVPQSSHVLSMLKTFISACADESMLSHLRAKIDYSLPPGRARHLAEQAAAKGLFALRTIILEMETVETAAKVTSKRAWQHSRQRSTMNKSSTGDHDSENLWTAAENDFSFFGEEGEEKDECGIYQHDPEKYFPTAHLDDKIFISGGDEFEGFPTPGGNSPRTSFSSERVVSSPVTNNAINRSYTTMLRSPRDLPLGRNRRPLNESQRNHAETRAKVTELPGSIPLSAISPPSPIQRKVPDEPMLDLVAELAKWRKERKQAYETEMARYQKFKAISTNGILAAVAALDTDLEMPFIEGHWKGEIKVVRNPTPKGRSGVVDIYGNYFEKGYLYP